MTTPAKNLIAVITFVVTNACGLRTRTKPLVSTNDFRLEGVKQLICSMGCTL